MSHESFLLLRIFLSILVFFKLWEWSFLHAYIHILQVYWHWIVLTEDLNITDTLKELLFKWIYPCACAHTQSCQLFGPYGLYPTRLLCPWDFPGKNTGVGCYFLLQYIYAYVLLMDFRTTSSGKQRYRHRYKVIVGREDNFSC